MLHGVCTFRPLAVKYVNSSQLLLFVCQRGGDLTKTQRKSQHPHSTALARWFYHPFSVIKTPSTYCKKSQLIMCPLFSVRLVKTPLSLDLTMLVQLVKNTPENGNAY